MSWDNVVTGDCWRITVLTSRLLRLEYQAQGRFEDRPTQTVVNRNFETPDFTLQDRDGQLEIITEDLQLLYDKKPFSASGLSIRLKKNRYTNNSIWRYGDPGENLKGTARTLDNCDGAIPLEDGVMSFSGFSLLDDSASMALTKEGWIEPPLEGHKDLYFFGYGHDFKGGLKDFYHLCGSTPMLPRYALGNWWSRYHAYTQQEYLDLMQRFREEKLPFSVCVIDMDWHLVRLEEKYGSGWTGYTWNPELFPDHVGMLKKLHEDGMRVTLNVHPADGVRGHEKAYPEMAKALGVDWEKEVPISFDIADRKFLDAYFKYLHHPLEEEGVDFWWIDWQQGNSTSVPGLDPLWMLNHYHYLDQCRKGQRGMVFSRYAGPGSHRYPIGFSGDSHITWESLAFQPYFTATASNIGYGWWSHDIGGHMCGYRDDELAARWVQFGVFSPIMRLHSSNSRFTGKEPWKYDREAEAAMGSFLRLRHQMIPYLYTMNERAHRENEPLIQPMYYQYPEKWEAFCAKNQYLFGTELMVHPITSPADQRTRMGSVVTWLPEGIWYDIFTGLRYQGEKKIRMFRTLESIPVLAPAGAIVPLQPAETVSSHTDNPEALQLLVFAGASGAFTLYEDDGVSLACENGACVRTEYGLQWDVEKNFRIHAAAGDLSLIPARRSYALEFYGIAADAVEAVLVDGTEVSCETCFDPARNVLTVKITPVSVTSEIEVRFKSSAALPENPVAYLLEKALNRAHTAYWIKDTVYELICKEGPAANAAQEAAAGSGRAGTLANQMATVSALDIPEEIKEMIFEILLA